MPTLQCLFCKHINPAEASFCNACGSQLNLQPCLQCGAVDGRSAKRCHKCDTPFTPPPASESDDVLTSVSQGDPSDYSSPIEAGVAGAKAMGQTPDQPGASNYSLSTVGAVASAEPVPTAKSRSGWLAPGMALLAVMAVVAAVFAMYDQRSEITVPMQAAVQAAPPVAESPAAPAPPMAPPPSETPVMPAAPTTPALAAQVDPVAEPVPTQEAPTAPAIVAEAPIKTPARAVPRATPRAVPAPTARPLPVAETSPKPRRAPATVKKCSPELAALGLCTP